VFFYIEFLAVPSKGLLALDSLEMQSLKMYQSDLARVISGSDKLE
jgi:hypothetical protein